jgi:mannose-6-phosphate isomerase-like protein (cupin superfamily)
MTGENEILSSKRGYLREDFKFYHLRDQKNMQFEFHYHDFNKIIVFISGNVTYLIEGKPYKLKPWDILFVSSNEIHRPIIDPNEAYERIVIWVNSRFLEKHNTDECNLLTCFNITSMQKFNLLRLNPETLKGIKIILQQLGDVYRDNDFGSHILRNAFFMQLMVYLNRILLGMKDIGNQVEIENDERIDRILDYINENLA